MSQPTTYLFERRALGFLALSLVSLAALLAYTLTGAVAQTNCTGYSQCPALQGQSDKNLPGNITYSFNDAEIAAAFGNDAAKIQDFKSRMAAATADWAQRTGRSITAAPAGQSGNVTFTSTCTKEVPHEQPQKS